MGFALIASLTLMMLLGLIAVGVLAIASTQNRLATHAAMQTEARQQALIGLDAALAEMQMALGPDQRVTANSGILSENQDMSQHILGVWDSWKHALYDKQDQGISSTYSEGRRSMFRRWLISSRNPKELSLIESANTLGKRMQGTRICLVGQGTLGSRAKENQYIYADMIEMPAANKNKAYYAWWVAGENQKVNITIEEQEKSTEEVEVLRKTWDTPAPSFAGVDTLSFLDSLSAADKKKIFTRKSLTMATGADEAEEDMFYNVTTYSHSLLTNVRDGGLKQDLNMLLSKASLSNTPFAPRSDQDCPIAEDNSLPSGSINMPIGSWQVLHAYYNTWPNGETQEGKSFSSRMEGTVTEATTLMSGDLIEEVTPIGDEVTYYSNRSINGNKQAGYARTPILTTFLSCWGLSVRPSEWGHRYVLNYIYSPLIMWWNPYNVRMKVGAKKLWCYALPYRTTSIQSWSERALAQDPERPWSAKMTIHPCSEGVGFGWQCCFRLDWGNYFVNSATDTTSDIIFEPGEIIAFTMSGNIQSVNEVVEIGNPQDAPFIVGDQPDLVANYSMQMHEYVNVDDPSANAGLNTYIDNFRARLRLEDAKYEFFDGNEGYGKHTQAAYLVSMGEVLMNGERYEDKRHVRATGREAFCVVHGYDGVDVPLTGDMDTQRHMASVDGFRGAKGISPTTFTLGWYDYENIEEGDMEFLTSKWNKEMLYSMPSFYVAVGIVPKSYNTSLNDGFPLFKGKDYRTKVWQHSSPALWGSALYKPDDQMRQYHPYQLAAIELGAGVDRGPLDTVNSRNGIYGLFSVGTGGGENVSFLSVLELPYHPPFSLAGFAGMRLTPGWYEKTSGTGKSIARMRRMQYQAGVPGVGIGNSFADPCLAADEVYAFHETKANLSRMTNNSPAFSDFYDHGFIINDALWDRWFCSSISDMPNHSRGTITMKQTLTDFINGEQKLPVSRYKRITTGEETTKTINRLLADDGWLHIARYLAIEGGFNINSISEEAWAATLQGLAKRDLLTNSGGRLRVLEKQNNDVLFSRFMVSTSSHPIDNASYSPLQGSTKLRPGLKMAAAWGEVRKLDPYEIRELARQIVKIVRQRGPFLNMADFINRRLDGGSEASLTGALQAAIDATDINRMFTDSDYSVKVQKQGTFYKYLQAAEGSMYTAAPGYLIQSDVLASLGNILTVRDDTFIVRAYGSVRNPRGTVLAQAWCEATVQRTLDYVDPTNKPEDTDNQEIAPYLKNNSKLTEINRIMGRKLRVISFRWLDSWDI